MTAERDITVDGVDYCVGFEWTVAAVIFTMTGNRATIGKCSGDGSCGFTGVQPSVIIIAEQGASRR